ncbi:MAG: phospholipase D-like domain-containing protein [Rhizonema sp. PD37]|nr:phospholipase D-like domain-containing protein [Rhizonema sp. PD37]
MIQNIDNLNSLPEPISIIEVEEIKTEVENLKQCLQSVSRLDLEIESIKPALSQINGIQQHLESLDISAGDLHDYARQLKNNVEQRINQIYLTTAELDERTQKFLQIPEQLKDIELLTTELDQRTIVLDERTCSISKIEQQLKAVQYLTTGLDKRTGHLLNSTHNLDQMQQQLTNLHELINGYVKTTDLENVLSCLSKEFSQQIDIVVNNRASEINQLLKDIRPAYQYELVIDRSGSRRVLMKALEEAQQRLIIVTPWLSKYSINKEILYKCRTILNQQAKIHVGWGHLSDIGKQSHPTQMTTQQFLQSVTQHSKNCGWKYDALPDLQKLEQEYSGQFQLKLLGTHEKFLVCDRSWAMLGSHNFLTSGTYSSERELGLLTNDPHIITDLISRFDNAKNLETKD